MRGANLLALPVATAVGSPVASAEIVHQFTRPMTVVGVLALVTSVAGYAGGLVAQQAQVAMTILDATSDPVVSDTRGTLEGANQVQVAAPLLALGGRAFHPFPLFRRVGTQDVWRFQFQNFDIAQAMTLHGVYLYLEPK